MSSAPATLLQDLVLNSAARDGSAPALTVKDETLSYAQLGAAVESFALRLLGHGLVQGERVAIFLDKRFETAVACFGTTTAGGAFVPVNPVLRAPQVAHILADCDVRFLVTTPERLQALAPALGGLRALERVILVADREPSDQDWPVAVSLWEQAGESNRAGEMPGTIDVDMAAIFYTSGSTGKPKGVVLSHRNLVAGAQSVAAYLGNSPADRILAVLPLSFDAGFSQLTTGFAAGAHVVMTDYLLPRDVVKLCAKHQITGLTGVPPLWIQLVEQDWPSEASDQVRYFANTGGRMPRSTLVKLREIFANADPFLMYGLTEAFRSTYLDPVEVDRRPDSIGKAIPNAQVMVVREDGSPCDPGENGELVHRGALVAMGYWNDPETTATRFKPAPNADPGIPTTELAVWSGDLVVADEEGFLYFVGRGDEMIKTSGYRVSPTEVEEAAYDTGLVRDAVAVGVEDPKLGQAIVLAVSPNDPGAFEESALVGELRRRLPSFMMPTAFEVCDDLPRSPNGKFDRTAIRAGLEKT